MSKTNPQQIVVPDFHLSVHIPRAPQQASLDMLHIHVKLNEQNQLVPTVAYERIENNRLFAALGTTDFVLFSFDTFSFQKQGLAKLHKLLYETGIDVVKFNTTMQKYWFFGHSASQLRGAQCYLCNKKHSEIEKVINGFGSFEKIEGVAKRAARIGLLMSSCEPGVKVANGDFIFVGDIERNGYNFTDGTFIFFFHITRMWINFQRFGI